MKKLIDHIINSLKNEGIVIQKYSSYSTNSVYLKIDYGVSNSLRISDHKGKAHLSYRFNLLMHIEKSHVDKGEYQRNFYCKSDIETLISDIIKHREAQIKKYSLSGYESLMKKNQLDNADKKGFWKQAVLV